MDKAGEEFRLSPVEGMEKATPRELTGSERKQESEKIQALMEQMSIPEDRARQLFEQGVEPAEEDAQGDAQEEWKEAA